MIKALEFIVQGKEMITVPWYTNPVLICKVLNRIAVRNERSALQDLKFILDESAALILKKQDDFYSVSHQR